MSKRSAQALELELMAPVPEEVDAAGHVGLALTVACACACDHAGAPFTIMEAGRVRATGELPAPCGGGRKPAEIRIRAPEDTGQFEWMLVVPAHEVGGRLHPEASLPFCFRTTPHETSLATWGHPSPVVVGESFPIALGAKCGNACSLTGKEIEIRDETGVRVATAILGGTPWPGTTALYWASIELAAPGRPGLFSWSLSLPGAQLPVPHRGASHGFAFVTVPPPDHLVSIKVVEKGTERPLDDAQVRLGVYRASTDQTGLAELAVHAGEHRLFIWKPGYEAPGSTIAVDGDRHVRVEAVVLPQEDPDAYWQG